MSGYTQNNYSHEVVMPIWLRPLVGKQRCKCIGFVSVLKIGCSNEAVLYSSKAALQRYLSSFWNLKENYSSVLSLVPCSYCIYVSASALSQTYSLLIISVCTKSIYIIILYIIGSSQNHICYFCRCKEKVQNFPAENSLPKSTSL